MKKKKHPPHVVFVNESFDLDPSNIASMQECTGLIPWAVNDDEQYESYNDIYNYSAEDADVYSYKR